MLYSSRDRQTRQWKTVTNGDLKHWKIACQHLAMINKLQGYDTKFGILASSYNSLSEAEEKVILDKENGLGSFISPRFIIDTRGQSKYRRLENLSNNWDNSDFNNNILLVDANAKELYFYANDNNTYAVYETGETNKHLATSFPFYRVGETKEYYNQSGDVVKRNNRFFTVLSADKSSPENYKKLLIKLVREPFWEDKPSAKELLEKLEHYLDKNKTSKNIYFASALVDLLFEYSLTEKAYDPLPTLMKNQEAQLFKDVRKHLLDRIVAEDYISPVNIKGEMVNRYQRNLSKLSSKGKRFYEVYFEEIG